MTSTGSYKLISFLRSRINHPLISSQLKVLHKKRNYSCEMPKKAVVFVAAGSEETECVSSIDVLCRGGIEVTVAGLPEKCPIKCSRGVVIVPDIGLSEVACKGPYDAIVLPGGLEGSKAFAECQELGKLLKEQESCGGIIAAICAAPTALKAHCIGVGKCITSYPSVEAGLTEGGTYVYKQDKVVVDGTLITSRGPGTSLDFALAILEQLTCKEKACEVAKAMLFPY